MNGLRVFINPQNQETPGGYGVFYCRREDGPYYRWSYEEKVKQWRVARVRTADLSPSTLCTTNWKVIPPSLRRSMVDHYQE